MIRWVRSMPDPIPPHRAYVHDELQKFYHTNYDYTKLVPWNDDCRLNLIEWDMVIGASEAQYFGQRGDPETSVVVAPALHYDTDPPHYVQRQRADSRFRWVTWRESQSDYSGFDLISFPQGYLRECYMWLCTQPSTCDTRLTDTNFSQWMYEVKHQKFEIDWSVQTIHLHYPLPTLDE